MFKKEIAFKVICLVILAISSLSGAKACDPSIDCKITISGSTLKLTKDSIKAGCFFADPDETEVYFSCKK